MRHLVQRAMKKVNTACGSQSERRPRPYFIENPLDIKKGHFRPKTKIKAKKIKNSGGPKTARTLLS